MTEILPHANALLNALVAVLLLWGRRAIRRGDRRLHPRLMLSALGVGLLFLAGYGLQVSLSGHRRFPGDDWVRVLFLAILGTHTALAVLTVPLVGGALGLALRGRLVAHRRLARLAWGVWLFVALSGIVIYWLNNHLRPPGGAG
ncbi:MAG: DUF420 domain-containing protein [Planctomycetota bacterium]|nr:MAG: DUF420 domain-containing protein [Planctomycetota bacterium]